MFTTSLSEIHNFIFTASSVFTKFTTQVLKCHFLSRLHFHNFSCATSFSFTSFSQLHFKKNQCFTVTTSLSLLHFYFFTITGSLSPLHAVTTSMSRLDLYFTVKELHFDDLEQTRTSPSQTILRFE